MLERITSQLFPIPHSQPGCLTIILRFTTILFVLSHQRTHRVYRNLWYPDNTARSANLFIWLVQSHTTHKHRQIFLKLTPLLFCDILYIRFFDGSLKVHMNQKEREAAVTTSISLPKGNIPVVKSTLSCSYMLQSLVLLDIDQMKMNSFFSDFGVMNEESWCKWFHDVVPIATIEEKEVIMSIPQIFEHEHQTPKMVICICNEVSGSCSWLDMYILFSALLYFIYSCSLCVLELNSLLFLPEIEAIK